MTEIRTSISEEVDRFLDGLVKSGPFTSKAELVRASLLNFVVQAGHIVRDFDKENILSPDGRVYQLEYARESALRGGPGVGLVYEDGLVLAASIPPLPKLMKRPEKVYRLSPGLGVLGSGLVADTRMLLRHLREVEPTTTDVAVDALVALYWEHTVNRSKRPLGTALLLGSTLEGEPRLVYLDPSGATVEYDAAAVGEGASARTEVLERRYRRGTAEDAETLALEALGRPEACEVVHLPA